MINLDAFGLRFSTLSLVQYARQKKDCLPGNIAINHKIYRAMQRESRCFCKPKYAGMFQNLLSTEGFET
ncbi:unnamed protein product, partial [Ceratitis capitata]